MRILVIFTLFAAAFGQDSGCGNEQHQFGLNGAFTSMNYDPENVRYDSNAYCSWILETSVMMGQAIQLEFDYFSVEAAPNCRYDSVTAFDGLDNTYPILRQMCGHSVPNPTVSTAQLMFVEFVSDASVEYYGFSAVWNARDEPVDCESGVTFRCGDDVNGYCIPVEQRCDDVQDCTNGEDEMGCPENSDLCGRPVIQPVIGNGTLSVNVIGGEEAVPGSWPWQASIELSFEHRCGATILNNLWVITAATCVYVSRDNPQVFDVITGNHDYIAKDPYEAKHDARQIFVHPSYAPFKDDYNFALVKVKGRISFVNDWHLDVCLPSESDVFGNGTETVITGWGDTVSAQDVGSVMLQQATVQVYDTAYCNDPSRWNGEVTPSLMCAGSSTVDACAGDDGGPMVWYRPPGPGSADDRWYLAGVIGDRTTSSHNCADANKPGLYGNVAHVIPWITDTMLNN